MSILVTGAAGFIGMHTCQRLLDQGERIVGIDNFNDYYDINLKKARVALLLKNKNFSFEYIDITNLETLKLCYEKEKFNSVIHLAAQAGVRYSIENPHVYAQSNIVGFLNILEICRQYSVAHLVYASSSSVYGGNAKTPFSEDDAVNHPVSLYAATKKANELMAHTYSHLYDLPTTGLRFFTVYGPWGRPDMSPVLFARAIFENKPIEVFNHGKMQRDFTYIDDIVEGVVRVLKKPATAYSNFDALNPTASSSSAPWRIFNIGNNQPVELLNYIEIMEKVIGKSAIKIFKPMQAGDVLATFADTQKLNEWVGFAPSTPLETGLYQFIKWVREYYQY